MNIVNKQLLFRSTKYLLPILGFLFLRIFIEPISLAQILIFAIFGIGYDLLLGYTGILSFGHAAFIGLGAYGAALYLTHLGESIASAIIAGILLATIMAFPLGYLSLRRRGLYFAMITMGLGQVFYFLAFKWRGLTGGSDGMTITRPNIALGWIDINIQGEFSFCLLVIGFFVIMYFFSFRIIDSPFGRVLQAIRENEDRARAIGYNVDAFLLCSFIISAFFGGVAGSLHALLFRFVSPDILYWSVSGTVVLMTIIGGIGTIYGPIIGSTIYILLQDVLSKQTTHWSLIFGCVFIFFVVFASNGIVGFLRENILFRGEKNNHKGGS